MNPSSDQPKSAQRPNQNDQLHSTEFDLEQVQPAIDLIGRVRQFRQKALLETAKDQLQQDQDTPRVRPAEIGDFIVDQDGTPRQIGRFEVVKRIGQGGFGIVFQAYDPSIDRHVALKIPRPEALLDESLRERFLREARAAGALNHSNIVTVFEASQVGPICFIVSAWCRGPSLHQWVNQKGPLVPEQTMNAMIVLSDAVQHAHNRGIIHRDLKPQNILIDLDDSNETADASGSVQSDSTAANEDGATVSTSASMESRLRISDFGLARVMSECASITQSGSIVGTPAYAAPEQLDGSSQPVDARADVYALGATMYFLLCGDPPFLGSTLLETIRKVQEELPRSPRKLNPLVSADLEAICLKCLEKDPQRRYQSASEFQSDLIRCRDGLPVMARRPSRLDRVIAWCRRRPAVAGLSAALVLLIFASSIVLGILLARSNQLKELAESHAVQAIAERDRARQALDAMTSGLATQQVLGQRELTPQQRRFLQQTVEWYRDLTATSSESEALDPTDQLWLARAEERLSQLLSRLGDMDGALSAVDRSIFLLEQLFAHDSRPEVIDELAKSLHRKDAILTNSGRHEEALPVIESAVEIARLGVDVEPTNSLTRSRLSNILGNVGSRYRNLNRLEDSVLAQLESLALKRQLIQEQPDDIEFERSLGISLMNLGNLLTQMSRMDEADEVLQEALELRQSLVDRNPNSHTLRYDLAFISRNMVGFCFRRGDYDRAADYAEQSVLQARELVEQNPLAAHYQRQLAESLSAWASVLVAQSRFELGVEVLEELTEVATEAITTFPDIPAYRVLLANGQSSWGEILFAQQRYVEAGERFDQAIAILESLLAAKTEISFATIELRKTLYHRGKNWERLSHYQEALHDFDTAIELADNETSANLFRLGRAMVLAQTDQVTEALDIVSKATDYENGLELSNRNHRVYVSAACAYGILSEQSDEEQRDELLDEALSYLEQAISAGLTDLSPLSYEPYLASLHQHPEFQALIASNRE